MYFYLVFSILFTFLFLYFGSSDLKQVPIIQESWAWNKNSEYGLKPDPRTKLNPLKLLNGYKQNKNSYIFSRSKIIEPSIDGELVEFPLLGEGYFQYKKIGDKLNFFSRDGELLWQKNYSSYPISTPKGKINFLVSGDGNQVLIIDQNGNQVGLKQADGRFLTDIAHTVSSGSVLLFSGGEIYRLDPHGNLIFKKSGLQEEKDKTMRFFKSISISEDGKKIALHYFAGNQDLITTLDEKGNYGKLNIALPHIYPHKIFMGLDNSESLLVNLPDALIQFNKEGKILHKTVKKKKESVHQVAFVKSGVFIGSIHNNLLFLDSAGFPIKIKEIGSQPFRVFDSGVPNFLFLESPKEIIGFQIY